MKNLKKLTILHSNDMHGDFLAEQIDERLVGGVSLLSGYVNKVRREEKNVIYAVAGDIDVYKRQALHSGRERRSHHPARSFQGLQPASAPFFHWSSGVISFQKAAHLFQDVYKRQIEEFGTDAENEILIGEDGFLLQGVVLLLDFGDVVAEGFVPVSYTHLDVYKRQMPVWMRRCRSWKTR